MKQWKGVDSVQYEDIRFSLRAQSYLQFINLLLRIHVSTMGTLLSQNLEPLAQMVRGNVYPLLQSVACTNLSKLVAGVEQVVASLG